MVAAPKHAWPNACSFRSACSTRGSTVGGGASVAGGTPLEQIGGRRLGATAARHRTLPGGPAQSGARRVPRAVARLISLRRRWRARLREQRVRGARAATGRWPYRYFAQLDPRVAIRGRDAARERRTFRRGARVDCGAGPRAGGGRRGATARRTARRPRRGPAPCHISPPRSRGNAGAQQRSNTSTDHNDVSVSNCT